MHIICSNHLALLLKELTLSRFLLTQTHLKTNFYLALFLIMLNSIHLMTLNYYKYTILWLLHFLIILSFSFKNLDYFLKNFKFFK